MRGLWTSTLAAPTSVISVDSSYVRCVRDGCHGLEWSKTSKVQMTWKEAVEYAKNLKSPVYYK